MIQSDKEMDVGLGSNSEKDDAKNPGNGSNTAKIHGVRGSFSPSFFKLRGGSKPIREMDRSDLQRIDTKQLEKRNNRKIVSLQAQNSVPPHLLMTSLLEQLCHKEVPENKELAEKLFKVLCENLSKLNVISPLSHLDEMKHLRKQHGITFKRLMGAALYNIQQSQKVRALPGISPMPSRGEQILMENELMDEFSSRYENEFQEMEHLGTGGFGSVFKAMNNLDKKCYAVKKIRFKQKNPDLLKKLLREVRVLARLQHTNIVGYNGAWIESQNPFCSSKGSSSDNTGTQDISCSNSPQKANENQSIEFLSENDSRPVNAAPYESLYRDGPSPAMGLAFGAKMFSQVKTNFTNPVCDFNALNLGQCHITEISEKSYDELWVDRSDNHPSQNEDSNIESEASGVNEDNIKKRPVKRTHSAVETICDDKPVSHSDESLNGEEAYKSSAGFSLSNSTAVYADESTGQGFSSGSTSVKADAQSSSSAEPKPFHQSEIKPETSSTDQYNDKHSSSLVSNVLTSGPQSSNELASSVSRNEDHININNSKKNFSNNMQLVPRSVLFTFPKSVSDSGTRDKFGPSNNDDFDYSSNNQGVVPSGTFLKTPALFGRSLSYVDGKKFGGVGESKNHSYDFQNSIVLYIQMELCCSTLYDWLLERNNSIDCNTAYHDSFCSCNMNVFRQLLEAVDFIHSSGLIHRDLKPRNIFLSLPDLHVKIGDFGLAKEEVMNDCLGSNLIQQDPIGPFAQKNHTTGVGTTGYAAPEQIQSSIYNAKSDMYSLGVILFEMFNLFRTDMERAKNIDKPSSSPCLPDVQKFWPKQAEAICQLTHQDPQRRPLSGELLRGELFLSQEKEIEILKQTIIEKDKIIASLRQEILQMKAERDEDFNATRLQ